LKARCSGTRRARFRRTPASSGYAERARGGTLFLDEIQHYAVGAAKRRCYAWLEERSFHRVGGETDVPLKARIVCATSRNLVEQVRLGRFREDLFYRINAVTVEVPPLRQRPEDISWLLSHYFAIFAEQGDCTLRGISSMAEEAALTARVARKCARTSESH